ncbi:methionyl-tRNA formyltransferase [Brevundimonas sp.]|jgi:methionyl-tRNA formyltransferase|uniref:methionyl-tRNA formyltransferase n=1 Tax=Brevundimonas sp. TaxID=1871086 RepID=UPI00391B8EF5
MRLAFMGTPDFAVPSLAELIASGHEVVGVWSQPPRPRGRGQKLTPSPVHAFAETMGLPVFTPESMKSPDAMAQFIDLDLDAACVVAYGQILKRDVLEAPRLGCFNLHGSLLPRWRGAAPIQRAIMAGDRQTGVQIMRMSEGLDEGPILLSEVLPILPDDTSATLGQRMAATGATLWSRALAAIERGGAVETPQVGEPTYAKKITPAEARIDWTRPAVEIDAHIRGLSPAPGAWFEVAGADGQPTRIKALMSQVSLKASGASGQVLDGELRIGTGTNGDGGAVRLLRVQRPGKAAQDAAEFLNGFPLPPGTVLG